MSFEEKDGEEFDQVKVALVPVVELHEQQVRALSLEGICPTPARRGYHRLPPLRVGASG